MGQSCRLAGEYVNSVIVLGQHYSQQVPAQNEVAYKWMSEAWDKLTPQHPQWHQMITKIARWFFESKAIPMLRELLLVLSERLEGPRLFKGFYFGLRQLAELDSARPSLKIARRALSVTPQLRGDPQFTQLLNELRR